MDPTLEFLCLLGAVVCFALAALGGTRRGRGAQPAVLVPLGLLLWVLPGVWAAGSRAF